jgi:hypothetical protein
MSDLLLRHRWMQSARFEQCIYGIEQGANVVRAIGRIPVACSHGRIGGKTPKSEQPYPVNLMNIQKKATI